MAPDTPCRLALLLLLAGCGRDHDLLVPRPAAVPPVAAGNDGAVAADHPPSLPAVGLLSIEPPVATLVVRDGAAAGITFEAYLVAGDRKVRVTEEVRWSADRRDLVRVGPDGLVATTTPHGGEVVVSATDGRSVATARVVVRMTLGRVGARLPFDVESRFAGEIDPGRAPELLYPNDGTLLPPNLPALEIHFRPRGGTVLHQITIQNELTEVQLYGRCEPFEGGCLQEVPPAVARAIIETNRGGQRLQLLVRSTDEAGGPVGTSAPVSLWYGDGDLRGTVYYWTVSGKTAVMRWTVDDPAMKSAERVAAPEATGGCVGCHSVSRSGNRMLVATGAGGSGTAVLTDLVDGTVRRLDARLAFASWGPNDERFVGTPAGSGPTEGAKDLMIFDGRSGASLAVVSLGGLRATQPDWSADGGRIAFTSVDLGLPSLDHQFGKGGISYVDREEPNWSWPRTLIAPIPGKNHHSPAISPDGQLIAYVESTCPTGNVGSACDAHDDPTARLWITPVPPSAGMRPRSLDTLNRPGAADRGPNLTSVSFPRWHPQSFRGPDGRTLYWITFSSPRRPGLRPNLGGRLIWMAAVDPAALVQGKDPSYAAFLLPHQDPTTSNHAPQWSSSRP